MCFSVAAVKTVCESGKVCVLDIDVEGVKQVKKTDLNPLLVFIKPPSLTDLESRLRGRNTETEESLQRRLDAARKEMVYGMQLSTFVKCLREMVSWLSHGLAQHWCH